ncbi:MAG TPA: choice-of-anchor D domain-containing protein [Solirubrobacteraceae bacterium]|nr:choice-of-anchor D domain-containing protein [Solirubrobacteraceae bacterium]
MGPYLGIVRSRSALALLVVVIVAGWWWAPGAHAASWQALVVNDSSASDSVTPIDLGTGVPGSPVGVGSLPLGIAIAPDAGTAYVVNAGATGASGQITPLDLATTPVSAESTIDIASSPGNFVAIAPNGAKAYMTDPADGKVFPIDLTASSATVGSAINVGGNPEGIAFSPDGSKAYVAMNANPLSPHPGTAEVLPITVATDAVGPAITTGLGPHPFSIAITPDGSTAYVGDAGAGTSDSVYPIPLPSGPVGSPITVGGAVVGIAIAPDGSMVYATTGSGVTPIPIPGTTHGTPIPVSGGAFAIAVTPDSKTIYVTNDTANTVTPIDASSGTPGSPISVGSTPRGIAITPDQAPVANFTVASAPPGSATTFDASASTVAFGTIASYVWNFGDGTANVSTTTPTTSHVYAHVGTYAATVTETDSAGTSTTGEVYTGQTASSVGNPSAATTRNVVIAAAGAGAPAVQLSATSLGFGTIGIGKTSLAQTITVTNTGTAPLIITSATLGGANPGDFAVMNDSCAGHTIAAGSSCIAQVTFASATVGGRGAALAFTDNASGSPHTVFLTGAATNRVTLSGHVTLNGQPVGGAAVEACPTGAQTACLSTQTSSDGAFSATVTAPPGASYSLTAFPPGGVNAGEGVLSPITIPKADFTGLDIALPAPPAIPSGVTFVSPSHGTETSGTANPVLFWNEPNQIQLSRSLFPAGGTVLVTQVIVRGTNAITGQPASKVVNVGGSVAGNAVGQVVGNGPVSVTIPPLDPIHGQVTTEVNYKVYPATSTLSPTGVLSTQILYEIYPPPSIIGAQPTDPLPAYFTNIGYPAGISVGPGSITGPDAKYFGIVPLTSYGVPPGTTDCGSVAAPLQQFNQSTTPTSTPPPSTSCGIAVGFAPDPSTHKIFYYATLDAPASGGGESGTIPVQLEGCDETTSTEASNVTGIDSCAAGNAPEGPQGEDPPPIIIPIYIDPSGSVYARTGHGPLVPLSGATVTLQASRSHRGPFSQVHNRSVVMSPANRHNPDRTSTLGSFGWDVLPGFYRVSAKHAGCRAASGRGASTLTKVLTVPPPALNLSLVLRCAHLRRAKTHVTLRAQKAPMGHVLLTARVRGRHPRGLVEFLAGRRVLGSVPVDTRDGRATLTITARSTRGFTARYQGDGLNAPSSGRG